MKACMPMKPQADARGNDIIRSGKLRLAIKTALLDLAEIVRRADDHIRRNLDQIQVRLGEALREDQAAASASRPTAAGVRR